MKLKTSILFLLSLKDNTQLQAKDLKISNSLYANYRLANFLNVNGIVSHKNISLVTTGIRGGVPLNLTKTISTEIGFSQIFNFSNNKSRIFMFDLSISHKTMPGYFIISGRNDYKWNIIIGTSRDTNKLWFINSNIIIDAQNYITLRFAYKLIDKINLIIRGNRSGINIGCTINIIEDNKAEENILKVNDEEVEENSGKENIPESYNTDIKEDPTSLNSSKSSVNVETYEEGCIKDDHNAYENRPVNSSFDSIIKSEENLNYTNNASDEEIHEQNKDFKNQENSESYNRMGKNDFYFPSFYNIKIDAFKREIRKGTRELNSNRAKLSEIIQIADKTTTIILTRQLLDLLKSTKGENQTDYIVFNEAPENFFTHDESITLEEYKDELNVVNSQLRFIIEKPFTEDVIYKRISNDGYQRFITDGFKITEQLYCNNSFKEQDYNNLFENDIENICDTNKILLLERIQPLKLIEPYLTPENRIFFKDCNIEPLPEIFPKIMHNYCGFNNEESKKIYEINKNIINKYLQKSIASYQEIKKNYEDPYVDSSLEALLIQFAKSIDPFLILNDLEGKTFIFHGYYLRNITICNTNKTSEFRSKSSYEIFKHSYKLLGKKYKEIKKCLAEKDSRYFIDKNMLIEECYKLMKSL